MDLPTAEPLGDLLAQIEDLRDLDNPRRGVWLAHPNVAQLERDRNFGPVTCGLVVTKNFDGRGGILLTNDRAVTDRAVSDRDSGVSMQVILGGLTGAGDGKPEDGVLVVQQMNGEWVTRESLVSLDQIVPTIDKFRMDGRWVRVMWAFEALRRRDGYLAADS